MLVVVVGIAAIDESRLNDNAGIVDAIHYEDGKELVCLRHIILCRFLSPTFLYFRGRGGNY